MGVGVGGPVISRGLMGGDGYILCEWNNCMVVISCGCIIIDSCNSVSWKSESWHIYRVAIMYGYKKNSGKPAAPHIYIVYCCTSSAWHEFTKTSTRGILNTSTTFSYQKTNIDAHLCLKTKYSLWIILSTIKEMNASILMIILFQNKGGGLKSCYIHLMSRSGTIELNFASQKC